MKANDWLQKATKILTETGIGTARLDSMILLEDELKVPRIKLLSSDIELIEANLSNLDAKLELRKMHLPLAYIRGKTEFYGREFIVNKDVLEPRPESETIIENLKQLPNINEVIDIGTGSGALAITAKLEIKYIDAYASDIDEKCLEVAKTNDRRYQTNIEFKHGDLLKPFLDSSFQTLAILANLPYVPNDYQINPAAINEPKLAIFGGMDGLDFYRNLFSQTDKLRVEKLYILTESLPFQHEGLAQIAGNNNFKLLKTDDFIQIFVKELN